MTPCDMTQNRRPVTPTSRNRITPVTHQGSSPRDDSTISAEPVSALSAIGSAILPKSVIRPRRRAISPSRKSVAEATPKVTQAAIRAASPPASSSTTNTGTRHRRATVRTFATLIRLGVGTPPAPAPRSSAASVSGRLNAARASPRPHGPTTICRRAVGYLRHQIGTLGAGHHGPDHVAGGQRAARQHLGGAVDLRGLVRGAPAIAPLAGRFLDEDIDGLAQPLGSPLRHELVGEVGQLLDPPGDLVAGQLPGQRRSLGAVLVGVAEDADGVEAGVGQELLQLRHVVLGLAGETHDEVGPGAGLRAPPPDLVQKRAEVLAVAKPPHRAQHPAAGVLEGQVEVR